MRMERLQYFRLRPRATTHAKVNVSFVDEPLPKVGSFPLFPPKGEGGRMNSPRHTAARRHNAIWLPTGPANGPNR